LTSPPDQAQIKPLGRRRRRISTTLETQPQKAAKELTAICAEELAERKGKLPVPKPKKPKAQAKPKSPDADTVGTVKNIRPKRPFVHSVPPASLPRGHR
jgi:hypothetical protein